MSITKRMCNKMCNNKGLLNTKKVVQRIICGIVFMTVFFSVGIIETKAAEENGVYSKTIEFKKGESVVIPVKPGKTGIYDVYFSDDGYEGDWYWYNQNKEEINSGSIYSDEGSGLWISRFYMVAGKTYYFEYKSKVDLTATLNLRYFTQVVTPELCVYNTEDWTNYYEEDILNNKIAGMTWDKDNKKLILDGVDGPYEIIVSKPYSYGACYKDTKDTEGTTDITVELKGKNNLTYTNKDGWGSVLSTNVFFSLTIVGDGTLDITKAGYGNAISASDIVIDGPTINLNLEDDRVGNGNYEKGEYIHAYETIDFKSGTITAKLTPRVLDSYVDSDDVYHSSKAIIYYPVLSGDKVTIDDADLIALYKNNTSGDVEYINGNALIRGDSTVDIKAGTIIMAADDKIIKSIENSKYTKEGICFSYEDGFKVNISDKALIFKRKPIDISNIEMSIEKDEYEYDGKAKTPQVYVRGLRPGIDYEIVYSDNIKPGTGKVTVKAKDGNEFFTGSKTFTFIIKDTAKGAVEGKNITDGIYIYKVVKQGTSSKIGEVSVIGLKKKSIKTVKIASVVRINNVRYKVVSIGRKAFKNNKKIKRVDIGKNIKTINWEAFAGCKKLKQVNCNSKVLKTIGKNAFKNDKKLKKFVIKSKKLKKVNKNAFKGVKKSCIIKVPKTKRKLYKKLLKKSGCKARIK
ncbi:MAG: leucine-rich repeat protein [Eubacterium sp.]|nr:leucine-rich repeat protein [Eubacterium sp.]